MSKARVLVAGLYVFLAPIWDKQERETSMKGSNEQGQGRRHHKQIELLTVAYVLLFSCLFIHYFSFFSQPFLFALILWYIFFSKERTRTNHKKMWAQLDKRCDLYKIIIVFSNACQTCWHRNSVFPTGFTILIFLNLGKLGWNRSKIFFSTS